MSIDTSASIASIRSQLTPELRYPTVAVLSNATMAAASDILQDPTTIRFETIVGFTATTVPGHPSVLVVGFAGKNRVPVAVICGNTHYYEGSSLSAVVYPIQVMADMGVKTLIVAAAAGSLTPEIGVGTIVTITDHISLANMTGTNAFVGPVSPNGQRFIDVSDDVYSLSLRRAAYKAAVSGSFDQSTYQEGVLTSVSGPFYETRAEARFLRLIGADVVSMGIVDEVVTARGMGMKVLVVTVVADVVPADRPASGMNAAAIGSGGKQIAPQAISHREISAICKEKAPAVTEIIVAVINGL